MSSPSSMWRHVSCANAPFFHKGMVIFRSSDIGAGVHRVEGVLEGRHADAAVGGEEILARAFAHREIAIDHALHGVDDFVRREARARDRAERTGLVSRSAERDLVGLDALALEAED